MVDWKEAYTFGDSGQQSWQIMLHAEGFTAMSGYHEPLEGVLRHDRRRLAALLDMVRYPNHAGIQAEGILLTQTFSERINNLVAFILHLNPPGATPTLQK